MSDMNIFFPWVIKAALKRVICLYTSYLSYRLCLLVSVACSNTSRILTIACLSSSQRMDTLTSAALRTLLECHTTVTTWTLYYMPFMWTTVTLKVTSRGVWWTISNGMTDMCKFKFIFSFLMDALTQSHLQITSSHCRLSNSVNFILCLVTLVPN